jgi:hypothetical protein
LRSTFTRSQSLWYFSSDVVWRTRFTTVTPQRKED